MPILGQQAGLLLLLAPALYLGHADVWLSAFDERAGPSSLARSGQSASASVELTAARAMCLAQLGRLEEARTLVGTLLDEVAEATGEDETPINALALLLQAAVALKHRAAAQVLAARLACVAHLAIADRFHTSMGRHLGDAAALGGDRPGARAYYLQGLEATGRIRFRPELALNHIRLADLLLDEGDESEALAHLDVAIPELREMKMQPWLEKALSLLKPVEHRAPAPTSGIEDTQGLTRREREVARLLAAGRSNREIADTLVITEGTVEVHVKHILSKLGLRSRAQVAAWAADDRG
jgi:DNA-binding CsgD family transcriptional regulator